MAKFRFAGQADAGEMPFLDHLEELRWTILWSLVAVLVCSALGFLLVMKFDVLAFLIRPVQPLLNGGKLKYLGPADAFIITLKLGLTVGVLLAFPVVAYQFWSFLSPGLLPKEKKVIVPTLYLGLVLFIAGMALAYWGVLPVALRFLAGFQQDTLEQSLVVEPFLAFVVKLLLGFGIVFETPVVMLLLGSMGLITSTTLRRTRRYAIVGVFVVAAVLTPPDVFSQMMMGLPLMALYEISIWLVWLTERRSREEPEPAGVGDVEEEDSGAEAPSVPLS